MVEVLGAIAQAIAIVKDIPAVQKVATDLLRRIELESSRGAGYVRPGKILEEVIQGETDKLRGLVSEYYSRDNDGTVDEIEKDRYRKRVAAQVCKLLRSLEPIKAQVADYETLVELFCRSLPAVI